ncbi:hypothetical protein [Candidatus Xianfuyuplasma coldseepsis]|uniref:Uncharacterized protein n=1 Tax=Candidatus Xianfuyuplasma coldseepsis TaxID=2782163 RepID=A0A7L7KUQ9_9MOLU|nr:hypothetical protein [Xianfuyuplasma coldseepsis]QMS85508.1 hypothetical protein G4Z02_07055 [Xianfuyuplasma coldseepsis]
MELQLNEKTLVEVSAKISVFKTIDKTGAIARQVTVRNDKIFAAEVATHRFTNYRLLLWMVVAAIFGGFAHYAYDTMFLGYNPNPPIIFAIFFVILIIGLIISVGKKKELRFVVQSGSAQPEMLRFDVGKDVPEKKLIDLMDVLVN